MNNKKIILISATALLIVACILISACTTGNVVSEQEDQKESIRIGALLPLSGKMAYVGEYMKEGIELAKNEINSAGGVNGRPIEIVYEDSQADAKTSITAYQKLAEVNDIHVFFITTSGATLGVAPLAEQEKNILFNIGSVSSKISSAGDYVFRHSVLPQDEIELIANFIYSKGYQRIGVINVNAEAGLSYKQEFENAFKILGGKITVEEIHEQGAADYKTQILKLKSANPEGVFAASYQNELGLILKQSEELGFKTQWFALADSQGPKLLEVAGAAADGVIYAHFFAPDATAIAQSYANKYKEKYGRESEQYAALSYDSLKAMAEAMKKCKEPDKDTACIKESLYSIKNFLAATGTISFDSNGDTRKTLFMKVVKDGEFVKYE